MINFFKSVCSFFSAVAEARAASSLARMGKIEEAKSFYK